MRDRFVRTTALLCLTIASVTACSVSVPSGKVGSRQGTSSAQRLASDLAVFPTINPVWMKGARTPKDRAVAIVMNERKWPLGTRLYVSDVITVRDGNHVTLPSFSEAVSKTHDGRIVLLDSHGRVVEVFPRSAVIQTQKDAQVQAVLPNLPLPYKYNHSKPFEVIK